MKQSAPERGAGSDDSHRGIGSVAGIARWDTCGKGIVRTCSSNAHRNQSNATRRECSIGGFCLFQALRLVNCSGANNYPAAVGRFQNHPVAVCRLLVSPEQLTYGKSERDLDLPEAAGRRSEGRASGKSDGTRSDRSETSGGVVLSAGWREVAEWCHAEGGVGHEC